MYLTCLPTWAWWLLVAHALFFAGVGGAAIVGEAFSAQNAEYGEAGILQPADLFGICLAMFGTVTAPLAAALSMIAVSASPSPRLRTAVSAYNFVAATLIASAAMVYCVRPGDTYSITNPPDNVQQMLGGMVFSIAILYALTAAYITGANARAESVTAQLDPRAWLQASRGEEFLGKNATLVVSGVALIAGVAFMCSILSSVMNFGPGGRGGLSRGARASRLCL